MWFGRSLLFFVFICCQLSFGLAQVPTAQFTLPAAVCLQQFTEVKNQSVNADSYQWDFCIEDFRQLTDNSLLPTASGLSGGAGYKLIEDQLGNWFGFVTGQFSYTVHRLDFGNSPFNTPVITSLGNPGSLLNQPQGIEIVFQDGSWFGFVGSDAGIIKLNFGNSLTNTPTASNLGTFGIAGGRFWDVRAVRQGTNWILVTANRDANSIVRINFGNSFNNSVNPGTDVFDTGPIPGANLPLGLDVIYTGTKWIVILPSYNANTIQQISFGANLFSGFVSEGIYGFSSLSRPYNLRIVREGNLFIAFVNNESSAISIINLQDLNPANAPEEVPSIGLPTFRGSSVARWEGKTILQGTDNSTSVTRRLVFHNDCGAAFEVSTQREPQSLFYTQAGTKKVELITTNATSGERSYDMEQTIVSSLTSPDISFTSQNMCAQHDINFTSLNTSGDIDTYAWDFGDAGTASQPNPTYQYASAGNYEVKLIVTASNGCTNSVQNGISIYNEPAADFTIPSVTPICTNQSYLFDNETVFDAGITPTWQWSVNGSAVTSSENLSYTFITTSVQELKLSATIPGCENIMIKNISTLVAGPLPDFSFTGQCEEENIIFTNTSSGTVSGYNWNFDDGQNSTDTNPTHLFSSPQVFNVTLTASNLAGCNNMKTKSVTIYSKPQVNFFLSPPPFSCNGTSSYFNDLTPNPTDSNIASWSWNFGDAGSSQNTSPLRNPQHTYANAGNYDVSLLVSTNFSCSATIQLPVTISQSPVANFNYTPPCEDELVNFSDASTGTIDSWDWMIGSTVYTTQNPTHTFVNSGTTNATLTVTASNDCIHTFNKAIVVPAKLSPDFSVSRNCTEQQTLFTDITNATADPVSSHSWNFEGLGTASGSPATFTFSNTGNVNVTLTITTQTGCEYPVSKAVNIGSPPQSNFTASPEEGAAPLAVQFTNASVGSTAYLWSFNDLGNTTSTQVSPMFTFQDVGDYEVRLVAYNAFSCSDTTYQQILVSPITGLEHEGNFYFDPPYPNPSRGNLFLRWTALQPGYLSVTILDVFGRTILESDLLSTAGRNETVINLNGLKAGAYFMQMRLGEKKMTFRVTVNPE